MTRARVVLSALVILAFGPGVASPAGAQAYPTRPIKLVVPFPAGGATDTSARLVAQGMSTRLGQTVVIENQGGAGGTIGARQVAQSAPDGYTLLMVAATNTFGIAPLLYKLDYEPLKTFTPVAMAVIEKQVMVVAPSLPAKTIAELVQYAKTNPGKLNYGNAVGIAPHFLVELFKIKTGARHRPCPLSRRRADDRGPARRPDSDDHQRQIGAAAAHPRRQAAAAGGDLGARAGRSLPDVPSMVEGGYLDAPYDTLVRDGGADGHARRGHRQAQCRDQRRAGGARHPRKLCAARHRGKSGTPADFAAVIAQEAPKWAEIVRLTGIKAAE